MPRAGWIAVLLAWLLGGCETADLATRLSDAEPATLSLNLMASSENSTTCLIASIDGTDVTGTYSRRLTSEYLVPAGSHRYVFECEDFAGSIAVRGYSFEMTIDARPGESYGFYREARSDRPYCFAVRTAKAGKDVLPLAEFCPDP